MNDTFVCVIGVNVLYDVCDVTLGDKQCASTPGIKQTFQLAALPGVDAHSE